MTEPAPRREGTEADIAGMRIYYRGPDGVERHVDWDRRLMVSEAVALMKSAQVAPREALTAVVDYFADPMATGAVIWMLRKFRGGEGDLRLLDVDVDLITIHDEWIDGDGVELDLAAPAEEETTGEGEGQAGAEPAEPPTSLMT